MLESSPTSAVLFLAAKETGCMAAGVWKLISNSQSVKKKKKISASQNNLEAYLMQAIPWPQIATEAKQNWCESFLHEVNQEKTG